MTMRPCIECGEPTTATRCDDCHKPNAPKITNARAAGYDSAWDKLSKRARQLQPFCQDCGSRDDLTTDHSPEAWRRKAAGKSIRLRDVAVVCRSCNSKRGQARPTSRKPQQTKESLDPGEGTRPDTMREPASKAQRPLHTASDSKIYGLRGLR